MTGSEIQVENGEFTRIHNTILEQLSRADLNGSEFRCLLYLLRKTYGFKKKQDTIAFSQWADATGLEKRQVIRAVTGMVERGYIYAIDNGNNRPKTYGFNKYLWDNQTSDKNDTSSSPSSVKNDTTTSDKNDTRLGQTSDKIDTKLVTNLSPTKEKKEITTLPTPQAGVGVGEATLKKSRKTKETDADKERRRTLLEAWKEVSGYTHYNPAQVNAGIAALDKAGCTPDEIAGLFRWMKQEFTWMKTSIYPQTMLKQLDEYRNRMKGHVNGTGPAKSVWFTAFDNPDEPEYIKQMKRGGVQ